MVVHSLRHLYTEATRPYKCWAEICVLYYNHHTRDAASLEMLRNAGSSTGTPSFSFWTTWRPCNCIVCALVIKSCVVLLDHVNMQTGITLVLTVNEATSSVSVHGGRRFQSSSCWRIHGRKDCNSMAKRERNC